MKNLFYLEQLESYYDEWREDLTHFTFAEFVQNEWEKREEIYGTLTPEKDTLAYYAGVILGEV